MRRRFAGFCISLLLLAIAVAALTRNGALGGTPHFVYALPLDPTSTAVVNVSDTPGPLSFTNGAPSAVTPVTLTNSDQSETYTMDLTVSDNTGSGAGWNLTVSMNQFTNGTHVLPTTSTSISSIATATCAGGGTCTLPTNSITYPLSTPSGTGALQGTATKFYNAAVNSGMGGILVTPTFSTIIPANAFAGTYTSTFVISLVSGP